MDLRQLNTFVLVAELGSLSKASARLRIAQPALSRQVRMLEEELKVSLFSRHGRGMTLTEEGELLLSRAVSILRQIEETRADLTEQAGAVRGKVVIGVPPTVGDVLAARIVDRFMNLYPEVTLRIVPAFTGYLLEWLQRGEIDLAIIYAQENPKDIRAIPLIVENLFLVGNAEDALSQHHAVPFETLVDHNLILPGPSHSLRFLIEKEADRKKMSLNVPVEADSLQTLKDLTRRGLGKTILPLASVHAEIESGALSAAPLIDPVLSRKLILAQPLGRTPSNAVVRFAEELNDEVRDMVTSGIWDGQLLS